MTLRNIESFGEKKTDRATGTDNAAATVTVTVASDEVGVVWWVGYSYDAAPTGKLTITIGSLKYDIDVVSTGAVYDFIDFGEHPIVGDALGDNIVVTLGAGGVGVIGKVQVGYS